MIIIMVIMVIMGMMIILMMMTVIRMEIRQIQHKYPSNQKKTGLKSLGLDDTKQNQYCLSSIKRQRPPGAWPKPERWKVSTAVNHRRRPVLVKGGQIMQMDEVALFGPSSNQDIISLFNLSPQTNKANIWQVHSEMLTDCQIGITANMIVWTAVAWIHVKRVTTYDRKWKKGKIGWNQVW